VAKFLVHFAFVVRMKSPYVRPASWLYCDNLLDESDVYIEYCSGTAKS
jgi:hypothetical protein